MLSTIVFVGAELSVRPDWRDFVAAPSAPRNYKDPEKIADYVKSAWSNLETGSTTHPLAGWVANVSMQFDKEQPIVTNAVDGYQQLTAKLAEHIASGNRLCLVGFGIRQIVRLLAIHSAMEGVSAWGLQSMSDPRRTSSALDVIDPMERLGLVASDEQIIALLRFIAIHKGGVDLSSVDAASLRFAPERMRCAKAVFDAFNMVSLCA